LNDATALANAQLTTPVYEKLPARVWWLGGLMLLIGIVTFVLMSVNGDGKGYLYLAFYSIPSNTAISVFPHEPILIYYGTFANIWIAATAATAGTIVAGWLDHRVFVPVLNYSKLISYKRSRFYKKAAAIFMKYPFATLVVTGFTPIPFWPFKFLCFSIHYPLKRYLSALSIGRFPRYVLLAWVGARFKVPAWILIATVIVIFSVYAIRGIPWLRQQIRLRRQARRAAESATKVA
jgi:membrane protein YqaA with SNARE-associated domain